MMRRGRDDDGRGKGGLVAVNGGDNFGEHGLEENAQRGGVGQRSRRRGDGGLAEGRNACGDWQRRCGPRKRSKGAVVWRGDEQRRSGKWVFCLGLCDCRFYKMRLWNWNWERRFGHVIAGNWLKMKEGW
ncbi:hypothetical protein M0R45_026079 [Rubus argutus]|uniref:Uncharacterized protein n=1 Tax=Rubus argutus TaxID=59490 RepID=A0AAW1WWI5_RUBAR